MNIRALENIWTAEPEKAWKKGETAEVEQKVGENLTSSPHFEEVKETSSKGATKNHGSSTRS